MKKIILILTVLILTALSLTSCGDKEDEIKDVVTLNVYNWGEYISDGFEGMPDTNAMFEEYFNTNLASKYGYRIKVNLTCRFSVITVQKRKGQKRVSFNNAL